ncbi:hypothetical protein Aca07nite_84510 [Actinoplanes capillaceus]|uniref:Uncharacterized protein n=1 Tax=Actinoplanes campanulatus TaxID=113559 RepID=A0ABQ3WYE2_9ACTN|nr:hypothetical protein [Actinoplanes capillaceus]GID51176.1 hypothetical protein Aca07nite_84510 [Actinoplanes capillaceus]
MHRTKALTFDPAAAQAWLLRRSGLPGFTVAEALGIDDNLTGRSLEGFLATVDNVLTADPAGLRRRDDITDLHLWRIPDGDTLDQGALITVDLANGIRLTTLHQDLKDFADRDQRGIAAVLSALAHIAAQVCQVVAAYEDANPHYQSEPEASR